MTSDEHRDFGGPDLEITLDFINTLENSRDGGAQEHLPTPAAARAWFADHATGARIPSRLTAADVERIRGARAAFREVADAVVARRPADPVAIREVNALLAQADVPQLVASGQGLAVESGHRAEPLVDLLAHLAGPLVELIADGDTERLRVCGDPTCRWVFYDRSRTGKRRWCDMATCGNRAKAARHRARQREATEGAA